MLIFVRGITLIPRDFIYHEYDIVQPSIRTLYDFSRTITIKED